MGAAVFLRMVLPTAKHSPLLSQGRELRSKAAGHADVQKDLSPTSISALQNSYSLSVSYAQVRYSSFGVFQS